MNIREVYDLDPEFREIWYSIQNLKEERFWIGCNPSNPEMFRKQAEEGFALMEKQSELYRQLNEVLKKYEKV